MSEQMETMGMMNPNHPSGMVAPTFLQRLCQLLRQRVNVYLNCQGCTAPLTGTLHAVGQDYLELHNGTEANGQVTVVPLWNVCAVNVAGTMDQICPAPTPYPGTVSPGMGEMPGCPKPGCPKQGGNTMGGYMPGNPYFGMDVKKDEE
ncbi:hypothetical protein [Desulforamulus aeronauticus]|uniref:Uncharacterized protein n=1 Tax=Desulforamulus aeronauticus DSM 10349 TaxID=1121421 RepID=A0A1M6VHC0_9FIRM|nr:hypothetical protein [Desulforamulus aeronauticus]SHK80771.1 hypothetical protein SAMN02745123_03206 [Desulforamulus aeronauticus DSM 10349]